MLSTPYNKVLKMKNTPCRVCRCQNASKIFDAKDYFLGTEKQYPYSKCSSCGSLSIINIPSEISELYKNYYSFSDPKKISNLKYLFYKYIIKKKGLLSKPILRLLNKQEDLPMKSLNKINIKSTSSILDVGCGSGSLLQLLSQMGFRHCVGVDPFLNKNYIYHNGVTLKKQDFYSINDKFDLIMFHHVLEHFPDPEKALLHASNLLSDDGICIVRLPDIDSYASLRYKENWFGIHAPFHFALPSRKGMASMIKKANLEIVNFVGEQLVEFFCYSMGHELGVSDYSSYGNRKYIEKYGLSRVPPLQSKAEIRDFIQRTKQVKKHNLCEWSVYYLKRGEMLEKVYS